MEQARTSALDPTKTQDADGDDAWGCPGAPTGQAQLPADADALVALANTALAAGPVDSSGDDRHLVVVHADLDVLTADPNRTRTGGGGGAGAGGGLSARARPGPDRGGRSAAGL